ncbi:hypothetical protein Adeg_1057 [Ammonifex degensii KC4]|uniref:Uncharacterized protein n=1 Tax=Ammonifex degensii (strain DSM 10501 / KC4) TaxID=429009 RepID=C9RD61_AMMDK|nr:hypothetical protein Adeg_1057 [Ammonifex degensii KC4]
MHAEKKLGLAAVPSQTLIHPIRREFLLLDCYKTTSSNNLRH